MRLLLLAVLISVASCVLGQGGQQGLVPKPTATSGVHPAARKAGELESQAKTLTEAGNHGAALKVRLKALTLLEEAFGPDDLAVAQALLNASESYLFIGQPENGLPLAIRAVKIRDRLLGSDHLDTARAILISSFMTRLVEGADKALPLETRGLFILEKYLGPDHLDVAQALGNQSITYSALGQNEKALSLQLRYLLIREKVLGLEHPLTARALALTARTYSVLAQHDKALPLQIRALAIYEKVVGPEHPDTGRALGTLALLYRQLAQHEKALPLEIRALSIFEKVLGPEHRDTAVALGNLSINYSDLAQYDKALPLQVRALAIQEKVLGPEHPETALALVNLALTYSKLAQYDNSLPLNVRALAIFEKVLAPESPRTAMALIDLAWTYTQLAQHEKALLLKLRALGILEKVQGPEHLDTAIALTSLAVTYSRLGQHDKALPLDLRAVAIREKVQGPEHRDTGIALGNLAHSYGELAQHEKALPLRVRALSILEKVKGPEHPDTASALSGLSTTYMELAQYEKTLQLRVRVLSISEKWMGLEHPDTAWALSNLSLIYKALAQYDNALPLQFRALSIFGKVLGLEHPDTASAMGNLESLYFAMGQYDNALPLAIKALAVREKVQGLGHSDTASAMGNLGSLYSAMGQYDKGLPLTVKALAIKEKVLGPEHPDTALTLANLALMYSNLTQHNKALPLQVRALAIWENALGPDHPSTAKLKVELATEILWQGNPESAFALMKSAINTLQVQRQLVSRIGSSELKSYSDSLSSWYQALADALIEQGRLSEGQQVLDMLKEDEQFEFIRRASDADPRGSRIGYTGTEQVWLKRYREIADQLGKLGAEERELEKQAKLGLTPEQKQRQQAIAADLKVAQSAFQSYLGEMREGLAQKGQARKVEVEEISDQAMRESQSLIKGLGDDVALLQYYVTDKRVGMLLTTPGIQLARNSAIDSKELNRKIGEFRRLLQDPKSNPVAAAQDLYRILVAPVEKDLKDAKIKTVMLSLDGALRYLPFGALHDGKQYLISQWNLPMYTSVTKNRLRDAVSPQWQAAGLGVTKAWPEFKPLAGVKAEMGAIVKTAAGGFMPGEVYLDEAFTAKRLMDVGQRKFPLMHVASHFRFSPGTEVNSFLLLGDGERLTLGDIRTQNYRFDNVDLLTLSACDTGLGGGRDEQGKEIEGFGVIAQQQGAKAILATLWPVADQSTATLMADMYRRRQSGSLTKIEALRQSQLALMLRTKYAHPYYWAPFILMGNWK